MKLKPPPSRPPIEPRPPRWTPKPKPPETLPKRSLLDQRDEQGRDAPALAVVVHEAAGHLGDRATDGLDRRQPVPLATARTSHGLLWPPWLWNQPEGVQAMGLPSCEHGLALCSHWKPGKGQRKSDEAHAPGCLPQRHGLGLQVGGGWCERLPPSPGASDERRSGDAQLQNHCPTGSAAQTESDRPPLSWAKVNAEYALSLICEVSLVQRQRRTASATPAQVDSAAVILRSLVQPPCGANGLARGCRLVGSETQTFLPTCALRRRQSTPC